MTVELDHTVIYTTPNTSLSQSDKTEKFVVSLFKQEIQLSVCALIAFKKKIKDIDLPAMFASEHSGIALIELPHCDRFFVFTIREILELRDLFAGAFTMLELNSMIHKTLIRKF